MVMRLFAPQFLVIWAFLGSAMAVHFRGKVRLGFWRQFTDHSTIMAPYNVLMYMFSAVPNRPILPKDTLPELKVLRDNWQTMREEALVLFAQGQIKAADKYNDWGFNSFFRTGWKRFYLKWYGAALPSALANCPKTVELLSSIPTVKGAMFASLPPGGKLVQHRDPYAGSLRYHLGLLVPKTRGRMPDLHRRRALLLARGRGHRVRRDLSALRREHHRRRPHHPVLRRRAAAAHPRHDRGQPLGLKHIINESATQNEEGEHVGWINRVFGYVYHVRLVGKRMKAWNKRVYYAVKFLLIGGILAAFLATAFA